MIVSVRASLTWTGFLPLTVFVALFPTSDLLAVSDADVVYVLGRGRVVAHGAPDVVLADA